MKNILSNKTFNKIYTKYDKNGYLETIFHDNKNNQAIFFDGIKFYYKSEMNIISKEYEMHPLFVGCSTYKMSAPPHCS
jgi:hypothetical protein